MMVLGNYYYYYIIICDLDLFHQAILVINAHTSWPIFSKLQKKSLQIFQEP